MPSYIVCNCWLFALKTMFKKKKESNIPLQYTRVSRTVHASRGSPGSCRKICEVKPIFIKMVNCSLPFVCVDICSDSTDTVVSGTLVPYQLKVLALNHTQSL